MSNAVGGSLCDYFVTAPKFIHNKRKSVKCKLGQSEPVIVLNVGNVNLHIFLNYALPKAFKG